jgi:hypothetical protein
MPKKYSDADAARIRQEAESILSRPSPFPVRDEREDYGSRIAADPPAATYDEADHRTRNQRHADEIAAQEEQFEREREAFKREERRERERIRRGLSEDQVAQLEGVIAEALSATTTALEAMEIELSRMHTENRDLKTKQAELEAALVKLREKMMERPTIDPARLAQERRQIERLAATEALVRDITARDRDREQRLKLEMGKHPAMADLIDELQAENKMLRDQLTGNVVDLKRRA